MDQNRRDTRFSSHVFLHLLVLIFVHLFFDQNLGDQLSAVFLHLLALIFLHLFFSCLMAASLAVRRRRSDAGDASGLGRRSWAAFEHDLLVRIFQTFDATEVTTGAAPINQICSNWRAAATDPLVWRTLDLTRLTSAYIRIPVPPFVYVRARSDQELFRALRVSLSLSRGSVRTLIFHIYCFIRQDQFTYTAQRCPEIRRLVLHYWNRISPDRACEAIRGWPHLESLTICSSIHSLPDPEPLMEEIYRSCPNFSELKIMGPVSVEFAGLIVRCMPGLRVLSLRCSCLDRQALIVLLDGLRSLERLNIAHCFLVHIPPASAPQVLLYQLDRSILQRAARLREFVTCMSHECRMCQRIRADKGIVQWYRYEEGLWKVDEIESLAV